VAWIKKEKPMPLNITEQARTAVEQWKYRAAFYARRRTQAAQPRRGSNQVLTAIQRRHFAAQIKH